MYKYLQAFVELMLNTNCTHALKVNTTTVYKHILVYTQNYTYSQYKFIVLLRVYISFGTINCFRKLFTYICNDRELCKCCIYIV